MNNRTYFSSLFNMTLLAIAFSTATVMAANQIVHDAEYYILEAQNGEKWAADDKAVDEKLAEFRKKNDGKPPNILYILIDDIGFGELGNPVLNHVRGYETPRINKLADQSMRFARMYTEPSCTPTRVAMMTGRQPYRMGMGVTSVAISGFGLPDNEVTIAEVLSEAGYNTVHIGKWHMGDIQEAWPNHQGFDYAAFPVHQQAQLALFSYDSELELQTIGRDSRSYNDKFTLDRTLRPDPAAMVTGVEGYRGKPVREVDLVPGEEWTQHKYREMNERYQRQILEHLDKLAKEDKPFFLQYWPLLPLTFTRHDVEEFKTPNGGTQVESMQELDGWIGDILDKIDRLRIAENTLVVVMGDNGNFTKYQPYSGYSPMIYRGGKADYTEGGVRVDAFARWPGMIEENSIVGDMIHVSDLFTTFVRIAGAIKYVPTDRLIDGVDQTALMLIGEEHSRRDHLFIYQGPVPRALVKEQYKLHIPGPGENLVVANFYDLYRDPREEKPVSTQIGAWAAESFSSMIKRHMMMKQRYPDTPPAYGRPYEGVENLRPESKAAVEAFMAGQPAKAAQ
jgi:arylsulfatase